MSRERLEQLRQRRRLQELRAMRAQMEGVSDPLQGSPLSQGAPSPSMGERALAFGENALAGVVNPAITAASGVAGGLATAGQAALNATGLSDGEPAYDVGTRVIEGVQDYQYQPQSQLGQEVQQDTAELLSPVGEAYSGSKEALGSATLEATDSPLAATAASMIPDVALEVMGARGLKKAKANMPDLSNDVRRSIIDAAPDIQKIRAKRDGLYDAIDEKGVKIRANIFDNFADNLSSKLKKDGIDPTLHPRATAAINRIAGAKGENIKLRDLETLRKVASNARATLEQADATMSGRIVDSIDEFTDNMANQIGKEGVEARGMAKRAIKNRDIVNMFEDAEIGAKRGASLEAGLGREAAKLLRNRKKKKFYTKDERQALLDIAKDSPLKEKLRTFSRVGISESNALTMMAAGAGGATGFLFGPYGAAVGAPLAIGALNKAKGMAQNTLERLTKESADFADAFNRAGKNSKAIAQAYLKYTPMKQRNAADLTDLFLNADVSPSDLAALGIKNKIVKDAQFLAEQSLKRISSAGMIAAPTYLDSEQNND